MPYRYVNVSGGQVIESEHVLDHLEGLARWTRTVVESSAPEVSVADAEAAQQNSEAAQVEFSEAVVEAEQSIADLNEQLETPAAEQDAADTVPFPKPSGVGADDRDAWIDYALANGKTAADLKNVRTKTIASWFE